MALSKQQLEDLDRQLDNAEVTANALEDTNLGLEGVEGEPKQHPITYRVFVQGALREENFVTAHSEAEAVEKVKANLLVKMEERERKQAALPQDAPGIGTEVTIKPRPVGRA